MGVNRSHGYMFTEAKGGCPSCVELRQKNFLLSSDRKISNLIILTWQDMQVLESVSKAFPPISELTDFLSGENHTMAHLQNE